MEILLLLFCKGHAPGGSGENSESGGVANQRSGVGDDADYNYSNMMGSRLGQRIAVPILEPSRSGRTMREGI